MSTIYDISCQSIQGKDETLATMKGKVLLIVNTASKCGFTPQFQGLENLYQKYRAQGLEILGFPCNQFGSQDPGNNEEILTFCHINYGVTFPMFAKVDVNGPDAHSLFKHLKAKAPGVLGSEAIKWNFTKFLVDQTGEVKERYAPATNPSDLEAPITALLNARAKQA
ncbi:MAG: glutathione peroxidase [Nitrospirales bacterium]|nr:glutathione peroxidase [Nitrospira sp.]MDR4460098.1 glutathione peroxidase [Nitrospirales bacterium]